MNFINTNENFNWGLNTEMDALLNGIDISSEKRVIMTAGDKQFIYDDGQIYSTSTTKYTKGKQITKEEFIIALKERIATTNIEMVKADVIDFVIDRRELDIWSTDYFMQVADMIQFE